MVSNGLLMHRATTKYLVRQLWHKLRSENLLLKSGKTQFTISHRVSIGSDPTPHTASLLCVFL